MQTAIIISPYSGTLAQMKEYQIYLCRCLLDSKSRGEAPLAFHLEELYPSLWNDFIPEERREAMMAAREWGRKVDIQAIYADYGVSSGMLEDMVFYFTRCPDIDCRLIGKNPQVLEIVGEEV